MYLFDLGKLEQRLRYLIDHGASLQGSGAILAALHRCHGVIPLLLANGADPNKSGSGYCDEDDESSMHRSRRPIVEAAARGHLDIVKTLLAYDADINAVDDSGKSALEAAEQNCKEKVVDLILSEYLYLILRMYGHYK